MRSGWTAPTGLSPAAPIAGWCACATARFSTAIGTIATCRVRNPTARTWRLRRPRLGPRRRSIATCAPQPKAAGTSARAGLRTGATSPQFAPPSWCRSISTVSWSNSRRRSPTPTLPRVLRRRAGEFAARADGADGGGATLPVGRGARRLHRLSLARGPAQRCAHRRHGGPAVLRPRRPGAGAPRGRGGPRPAPVAGRPGDHDRALPASNGTRPTAGRRCSGWRSKG